MQMKHHGEKFTQETLDPLMQFLGYWVEQKQTSILGTTR
jgi:hypothetical protein